MTGAQLRHLQKHDLLDLGAYVDKMRHQIAAHRTRFGAPLRLHTLSGAIRQDHRTEFRTIRLIVEGLN